MSSNRYRNRGGIWIGIGIGVGAGVELELGIGVWVGEGIVKEGIKALKSMKTRVLCWKESKITICFINILRI